MQSSMPSDLLGQIMQKIVEHCKKHKYDLSQQHMDNIAALYEMNYTVYSEPTLILAIEKYIKDLENSVHDDSWRKDRRETIFAVSVDIKSFNLPYFSKSDETFNFLISCLGSEIPFSLMNPSEKESLVKSMFPIRVRAGIELIVEKTTGTEMYIVEEGEFDVLIQGVPAKKLKRGSVIGEIALLHGIPRTATVVATQNSKVWSAQQTSFTFIRASDRLFRQGIARDALLADKELMKIIKTKENLENVLAGLQNKYILAENLCNLEEDDIAVVLKSAKIVNGKERYVKPNELIKTTFLAKTDVDCAILNFKCIKNLENSKNTN